MSRLQSPLPSAIDRRLRIAGPIVLFFTGMMFFRLRMYLELPKSKIAEQVFVAIACGYIGWEITRLTALYIQFKLPGLRRTGSRVGRNFIALVLLAHLLLLVRLAMHFVFGYGHWPSLESYSDTTGVILFYTTIILGTYETAYLVQQWKQTAIEKEALVRSEWQAKYDLLKSQINPHFLFNSLNSLSVLITEDTKRAEEFTNQLSRMYRYLLKTNDAGGQSTLEEELKFISTYASLLNVRYSDNLKLSININSEYLQHYIPSLTLQLLVENAVKHNAILRDMPLYVNITTNENQQVVVENNIQKKKSFVPSTGMGLKNINEKYRLLNSPNIVIEDDGKSFKVSVPLIPLE